MTSVWSAFLAGITKVHTEPTTSDIRTIFQQIGLCFLYLYVLTGAGMVWNDWVDRDIDRQVARTKNHPLASGKIKTSEALSWMVFQYVVAWYILDFMLSGEDISYSLLPTTAGIILYPFCKRPTAQKLGVYPQFVLAGAAAWTIITGGAAVAPEYLAYQYPLCMLVVTWIVYINTAYSYQDMVDDAKMKVNSLYVLAGGYLKLVVTVFAVGVPISIAWVLTRVDASPWLWISWMGVWSVSYVEQLAGFSATDPRSGGPVHAKNFALAAWTFVACSVELLLGVYPKLH
ncbi:hypothetical protein N7466_007083, partial [Penicillium verhagenii]|uniref:uncharacterized protein n=1 Tax=Penicillium verhagenii TaxID=1562060 RepID=UPI0025451D00